MIAPQYQGKVDSVWEYHKYIGYDQYIGQYGEPKDVKDFALKAQLVNYDQYRGLIEGFTSHMWDWYTGVIIWKTQNLWTALRGQMYDYYLDPNACLYGLHKAGEPVHVENNTFKIKRNMAMEIKTFDMNGKGTLLTKMPAEAAPSSVKSFVVIKDEIEKLRKDKGVFLSLRLTDANKNIISDNFYWLPNVEEKYEGLQQMKPAEAVVKARKIAADRIEVTITNPAGGPVAFFNRISLINAESKKRTLPVFYSDNYLSVLPGESKTIVMGYTPSSTNSNLLVSMKGWNTDEQFISIK